jgi:hypothetical protein
MKIAFLVLFILLLIFFAATVYIMVGLIYEEHGIKYDPFKKLKELFGRIRRYSATSACYTRMEYSGIATMGCCSGLAGGDASTGFLQYQCVGCVHYVDVGKNNGPT